MNEETHTCAYCGAPAIYQTRMGKWCCCEKKNQCPEIRRKNSEGLKRAHLAKQHWHNTVFVPWSKGLTKDTSEILARKAERQKISMSTEESRQQRSERQRKAWTPERRLQRSLEKKRLYAEHPEKHPNRKLAGNRAKMSYPERVAFDWLTKHNISFEHQRQFGKYFVDFYIPDRNLVLEIDGERWHDKQHDAIRDAWISENFQVSIIRIPAKSRIEGQLEKLMSEQAVGRSSRPTPTTCEDVF